MNLNLEYQDLLYFGYDWSDDCDENEQLEIEFKNQITEQFPNVKLVDAYDNIKGYRQEVYLEPSDSDNYFSWLFGKQWYEKSFTIQLFLISEETEEARRFLYKYLKLAKEQYPEAFKPESLL